MPHPSDSYPNIPWRCRNDAKCKKAARERGEELIVEEDDEGGKWAALMCLSCGGLIVPWAPFIGAAPLVHNARTT